MLSFFNRFKRTTDRQQTYKPVILVTGCGSGVGLALSKFLYQIESYRVVITARPHSLEFLQKTFKESDRFLIRALDITSEANRSAVVAEVFKKWGAINILVNNAGISYRSVVEHMTEADEFRQMSTNYLGPVGLIRAVLPHMRNRGRGKIINVSSVSGMLAMPTMASYSASKYALEGMSEALWYEARPLGISVSLVQPGFINSESFRKVNYSEFSAPDARTGPYVDYYEKMEPFIERLMHKSITTPESIARLIVKLIRTEKPPLWVPATLDAFVFYYLRRLVPRRILLPILFWALPGARRWAADYSQKRQ